MSSLIDLYLILFLHLPSLDPNLIFVIFSPTVFIPLFFPFLLLSRFALNVDAKEGNDWKEGKEWKKANKESKEVESSRPVSVMSSLSYRKRSNLDSKGDALFSSLKQSAKLENETLHKTKPKTSDLKDDTFSISSSRKSQPGDEINDTESVVSQAYSEANSRARTGMDSRWGDFDKESTISFTAPSRASTRLGLSSENDAKSTISLGLSSPHGRRYTSRLDESRGGRSLYGSGPSSPCFSRRSGGRSPGSVSQADSHMSLAHSCRLSEFDFDIDDSRSVAFTERPTYSPHSSTGRSISMPPPQARSSTADNDPADNWDIKTVSHRNYLDPDLEKAINEVLSFKPIKFKRRSLENSEGEEEKIKNDEDDNKVPNRNRAASSLRRSASAVDCMRSSRSASSCSSHHRSKSKSKKKKKSHNSESDSSGNDRGHRSCSKRRSKKSKKKSKKRDQSSSSSSSSSDSESDTGSESSSGASTISYRSSSSVKRAPVPKVSSPEEEEARPQSESQHLNKKDDKKRKKKVDSLMMKYLYRPDSD